MTEDEREEEMALGYALITGAPGEFIVLHTQECMERESLRCICDPKVLRIGAQA